MKMNKFKIGTKFIRAAGKKKAIETIEDIYITKNSKGKVVNIKYVCSHDFMGQKVYDYDVPSATIVRAKLIQGE